MSNIPNKSYDWYQTEAHVIIAVLRKNVRAEDVSIEFQQKELNITIKHGDSSEYVLHLSPLSHPIVPEQSSYKVLSTKVEIKLKKQDDMRWNELEGEEYLPELKKADANDPSVVSCTASAAGSTAAPVQVYPSSCRTQRNWDQIAKEAAAGEDEEDPLNGLFKKIYSEGSDEVRKAMVKSFTESSGTVLSTNWTEVKEGTVDVKPPDGLQYKKYEF